MKKTVFLALLALALCFLPPLLRPDRPPEGEPAAEATAAPEPDTAPEPTLTPRPTAPAVIRVLAEGEVLELDMQDYLTGVVAAEMPASFEGEALKAQAVAARTYALYCAASRKHPEAEVCTDYRCCQAWKDEDALRETWGEDYEANLTRVRAAVDETAGAYLSYAGQPVFAAFHASSAGATEDSGQVWSPQPYLLSVPSPESEETVPGFVSVLELSPLDLRDTVLSAHPEADFSGPEEAWIGETQRDGSGRVASLCLGGLELRGTELRQLFSLRSTAFELAYTEGLFRFTVTGSGHGVGMSQYGANVMAAAGADYREILAHYYPGAELIE